MSLMSPPGRLRCLGRRRRPIRIGSWAFTRTWVGEERWCPQQRPQGGKRRQKSASPLPVSLRQPRFPPDTDLLHQNTPEVDPARSKPTRRLGRDARKGEGQYLQIWHAYGSPSSRPNPQARRTPPDAPHQIDDGQPQRRPPLSRRGRGGTSAAADPGAAAPACPRLARRSRRRMQVHRAALQGLTEEEREMEQRDAGGAPRRPQRRRPSLPPGALAVGNDAARASGKPRRRRPPRGLRPAVSSGGGAAGGAGESGWRRGGLGFPRVASQATRGYGEEKKRKT